MRSTASYNLFPDEPRERAMVRARWLAREGQTGEAEAAYRDLLARNPAWKDCWVEYFELLRRDERLSDALGLAESAVAQFGDDAVAHTLRGAALVDLGQYRDALVALERALEHDPHLALAWHELGLAAHRLGDGNRALLALDRAFALEPHTETLKVRGRVLRDAGQYVAAEVAFEGAAQAAEHDEQRSEAEREVVATRRYAFFAPRRPADLAPAERWFADTGGVLLAPTPAPTPPTDEALVAAFLELARDRGWRFGQVIVIGPSGPVWHTLSAGLAAPLDSVGEFDTNRCPLVAAVRPLPADAAWQRLTQAIEEGTGLVFVLEHPAHLVTPIRADVVGVLTDRGERRARAPDGAAALSLAQHPAARCGGRRFPAPAVSAP